MAPRIKALTEYPTKNAPKGPAIPLAGPLFSYETALNPIHVHPEFSRL